MVLTHPFYCPVRVFEGHAYTEAVTHILSGEDWAIVTSEGWIRRGAVDALAKTCGKPKVIVSDVPPNPTFSSVVSRAPALVGVNKVVCLGGGSVIDAAKAMVGLIALGGDEAVLLERLKASAALGLEGDVQSLIAIPTTSGTGSEVTRWGTIWGDDGTKFSVMDPKLWPTDAVLDPDLCISMPMELTVATGLDAVSHAMEAIWNRRHNTVTDRLAFDALKTLFSDLGSAVSTPEDRAVRQRIQSAAVLSGLAMGTTQTALAHSISYPFTARYGLSHGIACSFTLPDIVAYNAEEDADRVAIIAAAFGCEVHALPGALEHWMRDLGMSAQLDACLPPNAADAFGDNLITPARAANNIRPIDGAGARTLAAQALQRFS